MAAMGKFLKVRANTSSGPASSSFPPVAQPRTQGIVPWPLHQNMFHFATSSSKSVMKLIQNIFKYFNFVN